MPSTNLFQRTLNLQCRPTRALLGDDADALDTIASIADLNFTTIENFVDDDPEIDPHFYTKAQNRNSSITQILTLLHNYLATVYSYNENLVEILPDYLPAHVPDPETGDFAGLSRGNTSQYTKKYNFLLGLRTDAQHGTFSGIKVAGEQVGQVRRKHHVKFDRHEFVNGTRLDDMNQYLRHTNRREREYVVSFIAGFHRYTFQRFHDDLLEWFGRFIS